MSTTTVSHRWLGRLVRRILLPLLLAGLVTGWASAPAGAHVEAVHSSTPEQHSVVTEVSEVTIEFVDGIDTETATFTLRRADGTDLALADPVFSAEDTTVTLTPESAEAEGLAEGRYRAGYQVNFGDGHVSTGVIEFEVSRDGESKAEPWPADDQAPARVEPDRADVSGQWPWLVGIGVVVVAGFAVVLVVQRRRSSRG